MKNPAEDTSCRFCHGATAFEYKVLVLAKYDVSFYRCQECGSLQSERPYWLQEAYSNLAASIDTGSARRVLDSFALVHVIALLFKCHKLLDFGGNTGFLCRLLRDRGYDAWSFDRYMVPTYAPHFVGSPQNQHDLVSAFEVIEHFESPEQQLEQIFGARPRIVLATTELFAGQPADWWYIAPREGQHIFFYSPRAVRLIAARFGYTAVLGRGFQLFSREPVGAVRRLLTGVLLRPRILRVLGALFLLKSGHGAQRDFAVLTQRTSTD
jgi:Methyltransferase domain